MRKTGFFICYALLPAAAAVTMKFFLDKKYIRTAHGPVRLCLRPVKWKLTIEK